MKTLKIFSIFSFLVLSVNFSFAQTEANETFHVSGECGMCKSKIEKAAKSAGASYALWDVDKKTLTVKYNSTSTNTAKIQESIAKVGYDTPKFKATDEAYSNLHECCKYDRSMIAKKACCDNGKCAMGDNCCKDGAACNEKDCCSGEKMDCCKDGKCTMEGHDGKDCCKKPEQKKN